jgi:DNA polymerase III subunit delta'
MVKTPTKAPSKAPAKAAPAKAKGGGRVIAPPAIEEIPEADRLGEFLHPRNTHRLHGHGAAERTLAETFAGGHMHHGWLIRGPEGIGKATLAYRIARHVLADPSERDALHTSLAVPDDSKAARGVRNLSHAGLLVLRRPWDQKNKRHMTIISVDEVRRLRNFTSHTAGDNAWRCVIVDTADELNIAAANALLKSLEEPPARTIFLLLASEPGRLLPTIRSRCRTLDLQPLNDTDLKRAVGDAYGAADKDPPDEALWPELLRLSGGSVRRALALINGDGLKLYERVRQFFALLPKVDWTAAHQLSDDLAGAAADQKFETFFELLLDLLARLVRARASGQGTADDLALASRVIPDGKLAVFASVWESIVREKAEYGALNLDKKTLILETLTRLEAAAKRG